MQVSTDITTDFDVIVIGGGLAGATQALCLAKTCPELKIAVVEAVPAKDDTQPSFDDRSIAIAKQSADFLIDHGLLDLNQTEVQSYTTAIKTVHVSDRGHFGKTRITAQEFDIAALGYVTEVRPFGRALHAQLAQSSISLFCPDSVVSHEYTESAAVVNLKSDQQLSAKLLVIADGGLSPSRHLLNIGFNTEAYQQHAIIANVEVANGHDCQAFERFTQHGPMALLPMSQNRYSLVWCQSAEQVEQLLALPEAEFLAQLQQAFGYRAGRFTQLGMRAHYPLALGQAERIVQHRTALIGNAAHLVHPIVGQGFNLGVRDIQALTAAIMQAVNHHHDIGHYRVLRRFEQARQQDLKTVLTLTDSLVRLFSNSSRLLALARSIGLMGMDLNTGLRKPLAKQLMGQIQQGVYL